jgi:hypothetical protein
MFFNSPSVPSPDNLEAFVKWMVKYGRDLAPLREPYLKHLDGFVDMCWRMINEEITEHKLFSADALMMRGGAIAQSYSDELQKFVDARGGIMHCPPDLQGTAVLALIRVAVMLRLAKYKYGAPIADDIVGPLKS